MHDQARGFYRGKRRYLRGKASAGPTVAHAVCHRSEIRLKTKRRKYPGTLAENRAADISPKSLRLGKGCDDAGLRFHALTHQTLDLRPQPGIALALQVAGGEDPLEP